MVNKIRKLLGARDEAGLTTAEYAVGTLGACTIGGVLVEVGRSDWFGNLVQDVIGQIPQLIPSIGGLFGLG